MDLYPGELLIRGLAWNITLSTFMTKVVLHRLHVVEIILFSRYQFAQLIQLQKRLGKAEFPLVEQAYYPNYKEMVNIEETLLLAGRLVGCMRKNEPDIGLKSKSKFSRIIKNN